MGRSESRGWLKLASIQTSSKGRDCRIATIPICSGLIVNAIVHAGLWIALFLGFSALRRARRTHRGLCPICAYELQRNHASGCPECGWNTTLNLVQT